MNRAVAGERQQKEETEKRTGQSQLANTSPFISAILPMSHCQQNIGMSVQ